MKMQQGIIKNMLMAGKSRSILLSVLFFLLFVSCKQDRIRVDQVTRITFWAMEKGIEVFMALGWEDVMCQGRDTIIANRDFIESFVDLLNDLCPEKNDYGGDKRSVAILEMQSGDSIIVAFGEHSNIHLNGKRMRDDSRIFSFIDEYVYGPHEHDTDYWCTDNERRIMTYMRVFFHQLDGAYSEEFLSRFTNPDIDAGYIVIPQDVDKFLVIENNTLSAIVYRGFYFDAYDSYGLFLQELMNNPCGFDLCKVANICKSFKRDLSIEVICKTDFELFKNRYLKSLESDTFGVGDEYSDKSPQIIKACFDKGYYIYRDCYSGEWYLHK